MAIFIRKLWNKKLTAHFSVDDTIWLFENLGHFQYDSVFEQPILNFFQRMNVQYGAKVSFYCFGTFQNLRLIDMTDCYRNEFEANSDWLRFGFHAANDEARYSECEPNCARTDYAAVMRELRRIVGKGAIDHFTRIHYYSGSRECLAAMAMEGLHGVLCAPEGNKNYYLDPNENEQIFKKGTWIDKKIPLSFKKTNIQIEKTADIKESIKAITGQRSWEAFTHEWALSSENLQKIEILFQCAHDRGYRFGFAEQ